MNNKIKRYLKKKWYNLLGLETFRGKFNVASLYVDGLVTVGEKSK